MEEIHARGHALSSSWARKAGNATAAVGRYAEGIAAIDQRLADISPRLMTTTNVVTLKWERLKAVQAMAPADMPPQDAVEIIEQMDSIHKSQTSERLAVMTARYQLEDQQSKNKELEKRNTVLTDLADQIQFRNLTLGFSFALLLVIGGLTYRSKSCLPPPWNWLLFRPNSNQPSKSLPPLERQRNRRLPSLACRKQTMRCARFNCASKTFTRGLSHDSANSTTTRKYRVRKRMGPNDGERIEDHF